MPRDVFWEDKLHNCQRSQCHPRCLKELEDERELCASFKRLKNLLCQDIRESELCSRPGLSVWDSWVAFLGQDGMRMRLVKNTQGSNRTLAPAFYKSRIYFPGILSPSAEKCISKSGKSGFSVLHAALCANASQGESSSSTDCQENPL